MIASPIIPATPTNQENVLIFSSYNSTTSTWPNINLHNSNITGSQMLETNHNQQSNNINTPIIRPVDLVEINQLPDLEMEELDLNDSNPLYNIDPWQHRVLRKDHSHVGRRFSSNNIAYC